MTYLLSCHGTIVYRDRTSGELSHRSAIAPPDGADALDIGDLNALLQVDIGHLLRKDAGTLDLTLAGGPLGGWTLSRAADDRTVRVARDGRFMTALAEQPSLTLTDGNHGQMADFLAIGPEDMTALRAILGGQWLVESTDAPAQPARPALTHGFGLRMGSLTLDLRWNLPFNLSEWPLRLTLLRDGWRIVRIFRYRPLVYFVAYGDPRVMRQFELCLTSLVTVGGYDGDIVVVTDKSQGEIGALLPVGSKATVSVLPTPAADRVSYMAARFAPLRWSGAWDYQPLLYADADILFDLPVAPMLHEIAMADRICAPAEPHSLANSPFFGGDLLAADGYRPDPALHGFNGGTLGIPNMARHARTLDLVVRILNNRLTQFGRGSLPFSDQSIANYVSYRVAPFDTEMLSRYVRLCNQEADPAGRRGLVHYCWVPDADMRVSVMEQYLDAVRAMGPPTQATAPPPPP